MSALAGNKTVLVDTSELNFDQSFEALKKVIQDRAK